MSSNYFNHFSNNFKKYFRYFEGKGPWHINCDIALPCAIENEIQYIDAYNLTKQDCRWLFEGSNMSCTSEAVKILKKYDINYLPSKVSRCLQLFSGY